MQRRVDPKAPPQEPKDTKLKDRNQKETKKARSYSRKHVNSRVRSKSIYKQRRTNFAWNLDFVLGDRDVSFLDEELLKHRASCPWFHQSNTVSNQQGAVQVTPGVPTARPAAQNEPANQAQICKYTFLLLID